MKNTALQRLLQKYVSKNNPKYISNDEIEEFFKENKDSISPDEFQEITIYFTGTLGVSRYVLKKYENVFSPGTTISSSKTNRQNEDVPGMERFREALALKRYSRRTVTAYTGALRRAHNWFRAELDISIDRISSEDARKFFLVLIEQIGVSNSMVRIYRYSILFYWNNILKRPLNLDFLEGLKNSRRLPEVLSHEEIERILAGIKNIKHRTMIGILYASGLRLSEMITLRVCDVDMESLVIHIRQGKGKKDRISVFSESLLKGLEYCMAGKGTLDYVFTTSLDINSSKKRHISSRTVQKVLHRAVENAGIKKHVTPHAFRHAFATHLLERGISLRHIQMLLGHKNISTTTIYTNVARPALKGIKSPL